LAEAAFDALKALSAYVPEGLYMAAMAAFLGLGAFAAQLESAAYQFVSPPPTEGANVRLGILGGRDYAPMSLDILAFTAATTITAQIGASTFVFPPATCMLDSGCSLVSAISDTTAHEMQSRGVVFTSCDTSAVGSGPDASETRLSAPATITISGASGVVTIVHIQLVWVVGCHLGGLILGLPTIMLLNSGLALATAGNRIVIHGPTGDGNIEFPLITPAFGGRIRPGVHIQTAPTASSTAAADAAAPSSSGGGDS
jgi:hypothetical protein